MKKQLTILTTFILLSMTILMAQSKDIRWLMDTTITVMKANAVNRDKVDWESIESNVHSQIVTVQNGYQLGPVCRYLFQSLSDFHGAFYCGDSTFKWKRPGHAISDSIMNEWRKGGRIRKEVLAHRIGYLRVPSIPFDPDRSKLDAKSQSLSDSLCALLKDGVTGVILDLRLDNGGAMYPMMLGLEQLLGQGKIGSFEGSGNQSWIVKDNNFYLDTLLLTTINPNCQIPKKDMPVVVLIGPGTGSSGEFLAMAFKNRKNTLFIGSESAGYVTSTHGFPINDAVSVLLAVGYGRDRTGHVYEKALLPDIINKDPDSFNNIPNDKKVILAANWIELTR